MDCSSSSRRLANAKKENVDPFSRKGEGAEGSDCHQVLMVRRWAFFFLTRRRCPCPGRSHVEFVGTDHRRSRQKGCLRRKTYFPVLGLRRRLVETPIAAEPPDGVVQDGG